MLDRYELATQLSVNQDRRQWYPDPLNYFEKVIMEAFPWDQFIQLQFENDPLLTMSREEREYMYKVKLSRERGRDIDRHRESSRACMRKLRARRKLEALKKSIAERAAQQASVASHQLLNANPIEANAVSHQLHTPANRSEAEASTGITQASEASHELLTPANASGAPSEARCGELSQPKRRKKRAPRRNPAAHQKPAPCITSATWLMSVLNENIYLALQRG